MKRKSEAEPPALESQEWESVIEAGEHSYRVYLSQGAIRYGPDEMWWTRLIYAGARRKAARELAKKLKSEARIATRAAYLESRRDA